ncbi:MAG: SufS family cysteine desulfurase [Oligoflexales bacterium]|nr:SufS family cysteine desulfurase [Oligoflexales bacterium]
MSINEVLAEFPNLGRQIDGRRLIYLDNAATTFKPKAVMTAMNDYLAQGCANIHRGVHRLSMEATANFENTREICRRFLNADRQEEIIFTSGTTMGLNVLALSLGQSYIKDGDEIILSAMEHHSNLVPWQMLQQRTGCKLRIVPLLANGSLDQQAYLGLLNERTKLVSLVHISNSLGTINPIKEMIQSAKKSGALTIIDAAQSVAHLPIDVKDLDCDFLVFSGHKLFGPTGVGVLYGKYKKLDSLPPVFGGGDMILNVTLEKSSYNTLPHRLEAGTPAIAEVIGLGAAIEFVERVGFAAIKQHDAEMLAYGKEKLSGLEGLRLIGTAKEKLPIFSFVLEGIHPHDIGTFLDEAALAVRTGHHCTQPVMQYFKIPATTRASCALYNNYEDIDVLASELKKIQEFFL